jgi:class 3 adenylate cyclase
MNEQSNRTFVCSVLFLDIAEYSKRSVAEQMTLKQRFNALLGQVLQNVAVNDRIVLDTGDGAAISFLGNPEDTLFAAMSLRDAISAESVSNPPVLAIRHGINLGPVRLIKDLNGQLNMIGDGINVAQRVMSFAQPGQILISRSYFEVVSRLSPEFSQLFRYEGARTDKHVREHEVYTVGPTSIALRKSASAASVANHAPSVRTKADSTAGAISIVKRWVKRPDAKLLVLLPLGVAIVLAAGVAIRMQRHAPEAKPVPQVAVQEPPPAPAPAESPKAAPTAPKPTGGGKDASGARVAPATQVSANAKPKKEAPAGQPAPITEQPSRQPVAVERPADIGTPPAPATLRLTIIPWGEVFVDGKSHGVSPPMRRISVSPGKHRIVVQNTSLPPHTEPVDLKPGEQITIRHRFN